MLMIVTCLAAGISTISFGMVDQAGVVHSSYKALDRGMARLMFVVLVFHTPSNVMFPIACIALYLVSAWLTGPVVMLPIWQDSRLHLQAQTVGWMPETYSHGE